MESFVDCTMLVSVKMYCLLAVARGKYTVINVSFLVKSGHFIDILRVMSCL